MMNAVRQGVFFGVIVVGLVTTQRPAMCQNRNDQSPAGQALESVFSPSRTPAKRTMGLLQRSFLDLVESSESALQVALVVDGTDSMATDIEGVRGALRKMLEDLRMYKGDQVQCGMVVYRDVGASSGEFTIPLRQFTGDVKVLEEAFATIRPESGAPYFPELPDLGVHEALSQLDWASEEGTSRWLLLFADAPPYDPDFEEAETGARRRYDTDVLINLAQRKGVQISCILCSSRGAEIDAYTQSLDKTRRFMNALATNTGGLMLDLSYPDIREALVAATKKERVEHQRVGQITREDIQQAKASAEAEKSSVAPSRRLRLAVLPHVSLGQITFDPDDEGVKIAAELRQKLRLLPQTDVSSPVDVARALRMLRSRNIPENEWLQSLAVRLRVDYVVWGSYRKSQGIVQVRSAMYDKADGDKVVGTAVLTTATIPQTELAGSLANQLMLEAFQQNAKPDLVATYTLVRNNANLNQELFMPVANNVAAHGDLVAGFEALEQALGHGAGTAEGQRLLDQAEKHLNEAASRETRNPFVRMLLASCYFNQAQALVQSGQADEAKSRIQQFSEALKLAYREVDRTPLRHIQDEIKADYNLLVRKQYDEAIRIYESLAEVKDDTKLHIALRAHWMLAGIYSGDWGVDPSYVDPAKAREHLIQILAHWGDSSEAAFIRQSLRWSEEEGRNQFEHFPRENELNLAGLF